VVMGWFSRAKPEASLADSILGTLTWDRRAKVWRGSWTSILAGVAFDLEIDGTESELDPQARQAILSLVTNPSGWLSAVQNELNVLRSNAADETPDLEALTKRRVGRDHAGPLRGRHRGYARVHELPVG
jgi:hypothetical protein